MSDRAGQTSDFNSLASNQDSLMALNPLEIPEKPAKTSHFAE